MIGNQTETEFLVCKTLKDLPAPSPIQRSQTDMKGFGFKQNVAGDKLNKNKAIVLYDSFLEPYAMILPAFFVNLKMFHSNEARNYVGLSREIASSKYIILELVERNFINWNRFVFANEKFYPILERQLTLAGSE